MTIQHTVDKNEVALLITVALSDPLLCSPFTNWSSISPLVASISPKNSVVATQCASKVVWMCMAVTRCGDIICMICDQTCEKFWAGRLASFLRKEPSAIVLSQSGALLTACNLLTSRVRAPVVNHTVDQTTIVHSHLHQKSSRVIKSRFERNVW